MISEGQTLFPFFYGTMKPLRFNYSQCPVCGARVKDGHYYIDGGILCESNEECPNGCYYHQFAYGNTETWITVRGHHFSFYGNYNDGPQECHVQSEAIDLIVACAQACLLEDYWKKFPALSEVPNGIPSSTD